MPSSVRRLAPVGVFLAFCIVGALAGWAVAIHARPAVFVRIWLELSEAWRVAVPLIYGGCVLVLATTGALIARWLVR